MAAQKREYLVNSPPEQNLPEGGEHALSHPGAPRLSVNGGEKLDQRTEEITA